MPATDIFQHRHLLRIEDYEFQDGNGTRDKYMIVLAKNDTEAFVLHTLTTSNPNGVNPPKKGCNQAGKISYFYFPKDDVVGENHFAFPSDTFIFFSGNIRRESLNSLSKYPSEKIELKDLLNKVEFKSLLDCMLYSDFVNAEQADMLTKAKNLI
ncbi:MAG: hypothetical protein DI539_00155 [Flavobacterium psychrophilum]|nr:MAG: hypothetical protein DI539_00155 [Flavobacterium psychrophilum]